MCCQTWWLFKQVALLVIIYSVLKLARKNLWKQKRSSFDIYLRGSYLQNDLIHPILNQNVLSDLHWITSWIISRWSFITLHLKEYIHFENCKANYYSLRMDSLPSLATPFIVWKIHISIISIVIAFIWIIHITSSIKR